MSISYSVRIDRDHTGVFAASEDISADVVALRWRLGMKAAYDSMADMGSAVITLRNPAGAYSPERTTLPMGARVQIASRRKGVDRVHFIGFISQIEPDTGALGRRQARLHLHDIQPFLAQSPAQLPPQANATADQVIARLLDSAILRPPILAGYLFIDRAGSNRIDTDRIFPAQSVSQRLAAGITRFAYVGDSWQASASARDAIAELAKSARGRFYISRDGTAVYLNRRYTLLRKTLAAKFDDDMAGCDYAYGADQLNRLTLRVTPRLVGNADSLLWQLPGAQPVPPRGQTLLTINLVDAHGQPVGLLDFKRLRWRFQAGASHRSRVIADNVKVRATPGATWLHALVSNHNRHSVWLTLLNVYGTPLYRGAPMQARAEDVASLHRHGIRSEWRDLPALSDVETAQDFADYEVSQRRHPRGVIRELRLDARQRPQAALGLTLFDRVRVSESQTGHSKRDYFIVGEAHEVDAGGARHVARWTLEPADMTSYFQIDSDRVDAESVMILPF